MRFCLVSDIPNANNQIKTIQTPFLNIRNPGGEVTTSPKPVSGENLLEIRVQFDAASPNALEDCLYDAILDLVIQGKANGCDPKKTLAHAQLTVIENRGTSEEFDLPLIDHLEKPYKVNTWLPGEAGRLFECAKDTLETSTEEESEKATKSTKR